jgi:hypothetical protein
MGVQPIRPLWCHDKREQTGSRPPLAGPNPQRQQIKRMPPPQQQMTFSAAIDFTPVGAVPGGTAPTLAA